MNLIFYPMTPAVMRTSMTLFLPAARPLISMISPFMKMFRYTAVAVYSTRVAKACLFWSPNTL